MRKNSQTDTKQLDKRNLAAGAVVQLRQMFLNGELKPGQRIVEFDLARRLDLSRGTVRDALKQLQDESIVKIIPNRGTFVVDLSIEDLHHFNELRGVLEGLGARTIAEKKNPEAIALLKASIQKLEETKLDLREFAKNDLRFHELLCHLSDNGFLYKQWLSMKTHIWFFICATQLFDSPGKQDMVDQHKEIFEAIQTGLPNVAEQVARRHSDIAGENLISFWRRKALQPELVNYGLSEGGIPGISESELGLNPPGTPRQD